MLDFSDFIEYFSNDKNTEVITLYIESIKKDIKEELKHISVDRTNVGEFVSHVLKNAIAHVLQSGNLNFNEFIEKHKKPVVLMFVGVNGTGKTLSIAKMAYLLKKQGFHDFTIFESSDGVGGLNDEQESTSDVGGRPRRSRSG